MCIRDRCCGLVAAGCEVTLVHTRPFAAELDWFGHSIVRICLKDLVSNSPRWWREVWSRLAGRPSNQCLAWVIWRLRPKDFDLVLWTDFQAQINLWPLAIARGLGLYRFKSAFFEHHPPESPRRRRVGGLVRARIRVSGVPMFVFSKDHRDAWRRHLGSSAHIEYVPYGVWPSSASQAARLKARQDLDLPSDARIVLVFGVQAVRRKNLDTLTEALRGFLSTKPVVTLFVGKTIGADAHPMSQWNEPRPVVRVDNRFVTEEEAATYFAACDAVWANYRSFPGASGVLLQAMGRGRLVIGCADGEIGDLSRTHSLGLIVGGPSLGAVRSALSELVDMPIGDQLQWETRIAEVGRAYSWPSVMGRLLRRMRLSAEVGDDEALASESTSGDRHARPLNTRDNH